MSNSKIRIAIVGAGGNAKARHIPGLQAQEGVEIISVCNRSRASSQKVADEFGIPRIMENWWDAVQSPDIDAVVIGTWPDMHCQVTLAALSAGKHVLCEARMARNAAEARAMLAASQAKPHLVAQVVPSPFTFRVDRTVKRLLSEGYLGKLLAVEVRDIQGFLDPEAPLNWRQDFEKSGMNTMTLGIWYEALMRWVGEATRVMALGKTFVPMRRDPENGTLRTAHVPEHLDVIADMACGAQAHFQISRISGLDPVNEIVLRGGRGTLRFSDGKLMGGRKGDNAMAEIDIPPKEEGAWRVEEEFIAAIRSRLGNGDRAEVTLTTFADGVRYMDFTEAVFRSMADGLAVGLPVSCQ